MATISANWSQHLCYAHFSHSSHFWHTKATVLFQWISEDSSVHWGLGTFFWHCCFGFLNIWSSLFGYWEKFLFKRKRKIKVFIMIVQIFSEKVNKFFVKKSKARKFCLVIRAKCSRNLDIFVRLSENCIFKVESQRGFEVLC